MTGQSHPSQTCPLWRTLLLGCTGFGPHTSISHSPPRAPTAPVTNATFFYRRLWKVHVTQRGPFVSVPAPSPRPSSIQCRAQTRPRLWVCSALLALGSWLWRRKRTPTGTGPPCPPSHPRALGLVLIAGCSPVPGLPLRPGGGSLHLGRLADTFQAPGAGAQGRPGSAGFCREGCPRALTRP